MPPPDFSQRKDVRKAEKLAEIAAQARISYTRRIMSEVEGRGWMHNLLTRCHVFATPFVRGAPDLTAFNCGEQNIGYQTFADVVNYCPNDYVLMMQEANLKEISSGRRPSDPEPTGPSAREPDGGSSPDGRAAGSEPLDPAVWDGVEDELGRVE